MWVSLKLWIQGKPQLSYILNLETAKTVLNSLAWESSKKALIDMRFCEKYEIHFS